MIRRQRNSWATHLSINLVAEHAPEADSQLSVIASIVGEQLRATLGTLTFLIGMSETNEPLIVDVDLKESDLQLANFWFGLKSWSNRLMLTVMPIAGLLLLRRVDLPTLFQRPLPAAGVLLFLGFPPFYLAMIWFRTRRGFASLQAFQTKIQYAFSPEGYSVRDIKSSANIDWDTILRVAESKHSFHLFFHKSLFHTIPKRCFKHADDIVRLRDLLKRSLGTKAIGF